MKLYGVRAGGGAIFVCWLGVTTLLAAYALLIQDPRGSRRASGPAFSGYHATARISTRGVQTPRAARWSDVELPVLRRIMKLMWVSNSCVTRYNPNPPFRIMLAEYRDPNQRCSSRSRQHSCKGL